MRIAGMLGLGVAALTALVLWGCQRSPAPLTPVSGKVSFRGFPLPGGTIVFTPDSTQGAAGPIAVGQIAQDGSYHLYTGDNLGAAAGKYRITVISLSPTPGQYPGQIFNAPVSYLPEKYRDPELAQLPCEIKANKPNTIDLRLD